MIAISVSVVLVAVLAYVYVADYLTVTPAAVAAATRSGATTLTLQTVPTYGHAPDPDWVSYLAQDSGGHWHHTTIFKLPAHTLVTVTIYQFDTATGLRNPFIAQVRGTRGGLAALNGRPFSVLNADLRFAHVHRARPRAERAAGGDLRRPPRTPAASRRAASATTTPRSRSAS